MLLFVQIDSETVEAEYYNQDKEYNYLINLGVRQFVSTYHCDKEFGYYFDNVKDKITIKITDPQIKEIYRIEPCE